MVAIAKALGWQKPSSARPFAPGVQPEPGVIMVSIRELQQLFDSFDPSPFRERDLNRDAEEYIIDSAKELPTAPTALVLYLDRKPAAPGEDQDIGAAIRTHFARRARILHTQLRRLLRRGFISLCIGLVILVAALAASSLLKSIEGRHFLYVIGESITIGGWVAMWYPIDVFLYQWWPILGTQRLHEALSKMPVRIVYTGTPSAPDAGRMTAQSPSPTAPA